MHNNGRDDSVPVRFAHKRRIPAIPKNWLARKEQSPIMERFVDHPLAAELETAIAAARDAGRLVNDLYARAAAAVYEKSDGSPVTDADLAADRLIRESISARFPADAFLTEESADDLTRLTARRCWIVDPIDGTAQFIARTGRFDVVIALVVDGRPAVGVICHPPSGSILFAIDKAGAWFDTDGHLRPARIPAASPNAPIRIAGTIWFGMPALEAERDRVAAAIGWVAAETLPIGVRPIELLDPNRPFDAVIGPIASSSTTYGGEWDFAAPDLIIREAGGMMSDLSGHPHQFNKARTRNSGGLIYSCDPDTHAKIVAVAATALPLDRDDD